MDDMRNIPETGNDRLEVNPETANNRNEVNPETANDRNEENNSEGRGAGELDESSHSEVDSDPLDFLSDSSDVEIVQREAMNYRADVLQKVGSRSVDHEVRVT